MKVFLCSVPGNRENHGGGGRAISAPAPWGAAQPGGTSLEELLRDLAGFSAPAAVAYSSPAQWVDALDLLQGPALPLGTA